MYDTPENFEIAIDPFSIELSLSFQPSDFHLLWIGAVFE